MGNIGYYNQPNFYNSVASLYYGALKPYFSDLLFNGDNTRIVYSSTEYALRRRMELNKNSNFDLPFMNIKESDIAPNSQRNWYNNSLNSIGIYVESLRRKIKMTPINITYESTMFLNQDDDLQIAYYNMMWANTNETKLTYTLNVNNQDVNMIAIVYFNQGYNNQYSERDWLEKNKIYTAGIDISVDTWYIQDNVEISIPTSIELDFGTINPDSATPVTEISPTVIPTEVDRQFDENEFD